MAAKLADLTYQEKRLALDALAVGVKLWRTDHVDDDGQLLRYEITASIPLQDPIAIRMPPSTAHSAHEARPTSSPPA